MTEESDVKIPIVNDKPDTRVLEPRVETYSNAEFDNPVLFDVIRKEATQTVQGGGLRTHMFTESDLPELQRLIEWLERRSFWMVDYFASNTASAYNQTPDHTKKFKVSQFWGMYYPARGGACIHNHYPVALNCCYYINAPEGCAPLIVNGKEIKVESGMMIAFPGHWSHEVPQSSDVDGRCMINFDILYYPDEF